MAKRQPKIARSPGVRLCRTERMGSEVTSFVGIGVRIDESAAIPDCSNDPIALGAATAPEENPIPHLEALIRIPFARHCDRFHVSSGNERVHSALVDGFSTAASADPLRTGPMHVPSNSPGARPRAKACPVLRMPSWWHRHHLARPGTVH